MLFWVISFLAILMSVVIVVMVLLQPSKGGGAGGAFGALGSNLGSTFGSRRTLDFLAKGTTWVAASLAILCVLANIFLAGGESSVKGTTLSTEGKTAVPTQSAPAQGGGFLNGGGAKAPAGGAKAPAGGGQQAPAGGGQQAPAGGGQQAPAGGGQQAPAGGGK